MVFWRETGWKDEEDEVEVLEVLEAGCSIVATGILGEAGRRRRPTKRGEDQLE